ncbi:MAG TPA: GNAT family N-acetyltransferase [Acidimicrobiales bacterium]|nr:GNAT family N-acetyltransferase [Acidimicrobiales bacterium]
MEVEIRRIRAHEGERFRDVRLRALQDAPGAFSSTFEEQRHRPMAYWDDQARIRSQGWQQTTFVADRRQPTGALIGMVGGFAGAGRPRVVELTSMWVDPAVRGTGIGTRLVAAVVDWARGGGADEVELWAVDENDPALALYQRCGFQTTGDVQPYPNHPDRHELRLRLGLGEVD